MAAQAPSDIEHLGRAEGTPKPPRMGICNRCCCCLSVTILILILIALGLALFFILFIKPSKPHFTLQNVHVQGFHVERSIHGFHNSAVYLSMDITLSFSASNPNKVGIDYSSTSFKCLYSDTLLALGTVPSFYQPAHSTASVQADMHVDRLNVLQSMSTHLLKDATVNDNVPLNFTGPVTARIRILGVESPKVQFSVNCLVVLSPRMQGVKSKDCNVAQVGW